MTAVAVTKKLAKSNVYIGKNALFAYLRIRRVLSPICYVSKAVQDLGYMYNEIVSSEKRKYRKVKPIFTEKGYDELKRALIERTKEIAQEGIVIIKKRKGIDQLYTIINKKEYNLDKELKIQGGYNGIS